MRTDDDIERDHNTKIKKLAILTGVNIVAMGFIFYLIISLGVCK